MLEFIIPFGRAGEAVPARGQPVASFHRSPLGDAGRQRSDVSSEEYEPFSDDGEARGFLV
jgi:hypothetical protein